MTDFRSCTTFHGQDFLARLCLPASLQKLVLLRSPSTTSLNMCTIDGVFLVLSLGRNVEVQCDYWYIMGHHTSHMKLGRLIQKYKVGLSTVHYIALPPRGYLTVNWLDGNQTSVCLGDFPSHQITYTLHIQGSLFQWSVKNTFFNFTTPDKNIGKKSHF